MKPVLLAFLVLLCPYLNAQNKKPLAIEDAQMSDYLDKRPLPTLTVKVLDAPGKTDIKCTMVTFGTSLQVTRHTTTNEKGEAHITLDQNLPYQQIWLNVGNYLYAGVYVNTDLTVTVNAANAKHKRIYFNGDGVVYTGTDGALNTAMTKQVLYKKREQDMLKKALDAAFHGKPLGHPDTTFYKRADSIYKELSRLDDEFITQYPAFEWAVRNETDSWLYATICIVHCGGDLPSNWLQKIKQHKPYFTSNDGVLFYRYLSQYTRFHKGLPSTGPAFRNQLTFIDRHFERPKADILKLSLLEAYKDTFATAYPSIIQSTRTKWCRRRMEEELVQASARQRDIDSLLALQKSLDKDSIYIGTPLGTLPFDANLYKLDSIGNVDDFIVHLQSKFKGKAIIIDLWATWCAPCLADLPSSRQLHEANKDLPVAYVYLCTSSSSSIALWKNKVAGMKIPGTHIFINDAILSKLRSRLDAEGGFPTYVVIDAAGKSHPKAITLMSRLNREQLKRVTGLQ